MSFIGYIEMVAAREGEGMRLKEPERITLVEGLELLEQYGPAEQAKARLRQAFIQKGFRQEPLFAFSYEGADIDWATGSVKIPQKRDRFCPTFTRAEFKSYFFEEASSHAASEAMGLSKKPALDAFGLSAVPPTASVPISSHGLPALAQPRSEIIQRLEGRIRLAEEMQSRHLESTEDFETYRSDTMKWWSYNQAMLRNMFIDSSVYQEYSIATKLKSLLEQLEFYPEAGTVASAKGDASSPHNPSKVFVVHGHDKGAREGVARFLEKLGLTAIILAEQPNRGRTIIEKFIDSAREVGFAVVLLTPDDFGGAATDESQKRRARQNVIFELGYFVGSLGRGRACLLRGGEVEIPSDLYGVVYTTMDSGNGWKIELARELRDAGFEFDAEKVLA